MNKTTSAALFFLAAGLLTSVSILSGYQILFAISMIYYTYFAIKMKEYRIPASGYWLLAFAAIALLSLILNYDLVPKPSKNFGRVKYFLFGVAGIFALRAWLKDSSDKTKKFILNTFFLSVVIAGFYSIYTFIFGEDVRAEGLTETMRYGYGSAMLLLLILGGILHLGPKKKEYFDLKWAVPAFIIGFIGMYLTYTRGALLGFLCGMPFLLFYYQKKLGIIFGAICLIIVGTLGAFYLFGTGNHNSRLLMNKNSESDTIRQSQWQAAIIAIKEKPILGWGLSNFHSQLKRIKNENDLGAKEYDDAHSHNLFLEIGSGTGLVGLFIFIGWIITWAYECFTNKGLVRALVVPFGVAFVISSQFEVTFDANNASMIFFIYALSSARKEVTT